MILNKIKVFKKKINKLPIKYLTFGLKKKNFYTRNYGRSKRKLRFIDFFRYFNNIPAYVLRIEYDPNRTSLIALICYKNGLLSYIIAPTGLKKNTYISSSILLPGYVNNLNKFKYGSFIHCVELIKNYGSKIARSAGSYCIILNKYDLDENKLILKLPSGELRLIHNMNKAALGIVSNINLKFLKLKKAGNNRWLGKKPVVRGVAKNAVDHPHGGGRGKTSKLSVCSNFTKKVLRGVRLKKKKLLYLIKDRKQKW